MGDIEQREPGPEDAAVVRVVPRIDAVPAAEWDACARGADPKGTNDRSSNPFISHAFLRALEESKSATRGTGWLPQHLVLEDATGGIAIAELIPGEWQLAQSGTYTIVVYSLNGVPGVYRFGLERDPSLSP